MRRISVDGSSGAGKSTVARALSARLALPCLELDSIFHQPGWKPRAADAFRAKVAGFAARDAWVIDGNYTSHGATDIIWRRADTVVWVDLSRTVVMARVIRRTLRRVFTREELWNGNREPWTNLYSTDPEQNIMVWAWTRFEETRRRYETMTADAAWSRLTVVRLRQPREVERFLEETDVRTETAGSGAG